MNMGYLFNVMDYINIGRDFSALASVNVSDADYQADGRTL